MFASLKKTVFTSIQHYLAKLHFYFNNENLKTEINSNSTSVIVTTKDYIITNLINLIKVCIFVGKSFSCSLGNCHM